MADALLACLVYTDLELEGGRQEMVPGGTLPGSTCLRKECNMGENLNVRTKVRAGKASNSSMARTGIYRLLTAAEICILIGVIILFNAFPEKVGIYSSAVEPCIFVPLLTPAWLP